jgi:hypothetical protein
MRATQRTAAHRCEATGGRVSVAGRERPANRETRYARRGAGSNGLRAEGIGAFVTHIPGNVTLRMGAMHTLYI